MADPRASFLIIGAQKAGTTALFDYLAEHPDVAMPAEKEAHHFDDETVDWAAPDHDRYHALFPPLDGRLRGEATPIYGYWPNALERIAAYRPEIKLIFLTRDPVERAWSHWRMESARGVETQPFAWCIRQGRQRLFDAEPWGHHREFSYVERGFYAEQVERMFGLFPRDQALILRAEDLRARPSDVLAQVAGFLALTPLPNPGPRAVHVGEDRGAVPEDDGVHLRAVYAADNARLLAATGISY